MMELLFLYVPRQLLLALDGQDVVLDGDVDVLARHVRQFRLEHEFLVAVLIDVNGRHPRRGARAEAEVTEWIPTNDCHGLCLLNELITRPSPLLRTRRRQLLRLSHPNHWNPWNHSDSHKAFAR